MEINAYVLISLACIVIALVAVIRSRRDSRRDSIRASRMVRALEFAYSQLNEVFRGLYENEEMIKKIPQSGRYYGFFDVCELAVFNGINRIKSEIGISQITKPDHAIMTRIDTILNSLTPEDTEYVKQLHDNTTKRLPPLMFLLLIDPLLEIIENKRHERDVRLLTPSVSLSSDLDFDSSDYVEVIMELEESLWISIEEREIIEELGSVFSFGDLVLFAEKKYQEFRENECK
jgi:acyl carrier protein